MADMENLVGMTAVQADYIKGLGAWWGGALVIPFLLFPFASPRRGSFCFLFVPFCFVWSLSHMIKEVWIGSRARPEKEADETDSDARETMDD